MHTWVNVFRSSRWSWIHPPSLIASSLSLIIGGFHSTSMYCLESERDPACFWHQWQVVCSMSALCESKWLDKGANITDLPQTCQPLCGRPCTLLLVIKLLSECVSVDRQASDCHLGCGSLKVTEVFFKDVLSCSRHSQPQLFLFVLLYDVKLLHHPVWCCRLTVNRYKLKCWTKIMNQLLDNFPIDLLLKFSSRTCLLKSLSQTFTLLNALFRSLHC